MKYLNQHAIITGGSSGIGKAVAKLLTQQGANITLIARDRHKLAQAQQELQQVMVNQTQQINIAQADVADRASITSALEQAIATLGSPKLLITSAGITHPGYFTEIPLEIFEQIMSVNYFGSLYSIKAVLPAMIEHPPGQIVLISSGAGLIGIYGYSAYCPSKFALRGLAESLRGELKPKGIKLTVVYPPDTDTPQLAAENKIKPPETKQITASAQVLTAEAVAQEILQGVAKNKFAIAPGMELMTLNRWHSLLSPLLNWYFDRIVDKTVDRTNQ
ncbi:short-chain dehydrogenase [Pleurocapsa sp. CCALA 161]|uniref:SDR family oxidoreductase n=1 Tax=Pleurocapsa sp. CCALA 161 TaxID=2107688 RepID=UPI000D065886|nr:SDR family oxidoreductase [Pleurocapsa sp. CCALA 161]PSB12693.1 short-chain dehydrogenase [Pleurocapsa sp. CCALA 161]